MDRHSENAAAIADFLAGHPRVARLLYPYHPSHPQAGLAGRQMRSGGGMVSFILKGGAEQPCRVAESTRLFALAESLGGVESIDRGALRHDSRLHSQFTPGC